MHAQMRPDGAIVLTIEASELIDVESAFMNGETACELAQDSADLDDEMDLADLYEAAHWLDELGTCLGIAEGRPPGRPRLRAVK
jgi:hypothetical protein